MSVRLFQVSAGCLLIAAMLALTVHSQRGLAVIQKSASTHTSEALYLPNENAVKFISFRYEKVLANYLWFRTINYFGKHYASDQHYQWLYHMCDLVTTLDPRARHVYEFCGSMLAWEVNAPAEARTLLTKAVEHDPDYWKFPYLRGFVSLYFLNDPESAKDDFMRASKLPGVHPMVVGLAAKTVALQDDPGQAIAFLENILKTTDDQFARKVLIDRLRELSYERDLRRLEGALERFRAARGENPPSIEALAPFLDAEVSLSDPYGGRYTLDGGAIKSTSNHKRLGRKS